MAKYSKKAQNKIEKVMHEMKEGTLRSGGSGKKVKNRKQAIAIGISEAREAGAKVPSSAKAKAGKPKKKGAKKSAKKVTKKTNSAKASAGKSSKKTASKKRATKKVGARKSAPKKANSIKRVKK